MSNLKLVQSVYDAFGKGDIPTVLGSLSPEVQWTEAEGFPYGGTYVGPDAVLEGVFMRLGTEWEGFSAVPEEFIDGGETVVALGKYGGTYKAVGCGRKAYYQTLCEGLRCEVKGEGEGPVGWRDRPDPSAPVLPR